MDEAHRIEMERLQREGTRNEGERAMLNRYLKGEPEPVPGKAYIYKPNDQVLVDLIRDIHPPREARPEDVASVSVRSLRLLIAYAHYGDTARWHGRNQVPELSSLDELKHAINVKVSAMAARKELPKMTGKDWHNYGAATQTFADKLAWTLDQAFVFAEKIRERG